MDNAVQWASKPEIWRAIEALAARLLDEQELTGQEARRIVETAAIFAR